MRCQVCGKVITGNPVTRKTYCVNKLYGSVLMLACAGGLGTG